MARYCKVGLVLLCGLVLQPADLRAADAPGKAAGTKFEVLEKGKHDAVEFDLANDKKKAELIQLINEGKLESAQAKHDPNLMALAWDLGLWTIVIFVLLFIILRKGAWGPILEGLQKREANINSALEEAKKAREETLTVRAELQKQLDHAAETVRGIMDEARRDAKHLQDEMLATARKDIQTERDRQRREIEMAKDQALQDIYQQAVQLATLISVKTVRKQLSVSDHRSLVDEALTELKTAGTQRQRQIAGI